MTRDPIVDLCLVMLGMAACWGCLVACAVALELWRARAQGRRACLRRAVLVCCGIAITAPAPGALADDQGLAGLPMPDRAVGPSHHRTHHPAADAPAHTVVVRRGDCLWHLAAAGLPADATDRQVEARWRAMYRLNRTLIGPDPDVIQPGQRLVLPR